MSDDLVGGILSFGRVVESFGCQTWWPLVPVNVNMPVYETPRHILQPMLFSACTQERLMRGFPTNACRNFAMSFGGHRLEHLFGSRAYLSLDGSSVSAISFYLFRKGVLGWVVSKAGWFWSEGLCL